MGIGLKLSEFPDADTLDGTELVGLVQNEENVKAALSLIAAFALGITTADGVNEGIVINAVGDLLAIGLATATFQPLTDQATIAWDMSTAAGFNAKVTLGGNRAFGTPTNPQEGRTYSLKIIQDGTGSRTITDWGDFDFGEAGEPTLSTAAGKIDMVYIQCLETAGPTFRAVFNKAA